MSQYDKDLDTLTRTIWGEARGELYGDRVAIANVVMNRFRSDKWFSANTVAGVCRKPYQFSCWNMSDPNRPGLLNVNPADPVFSECMEIATQALDGALPDITFGSTHYFAGSWQPWHLIKNKPEWAKGKMPVVRIGKHFFYNKVD